MGWQWLDVIVALGRRVFMRFRWVFPGRLDVGDGLREAQGLAPVGITVC